MTTDSTDPEVLRAEIARLTAALEQATAKPKKAPLKVSPLAPRTGFPDLPAIDGVRIATAAAGVRYKGRTDVMLAEVAAGSAIAGTFTRSQTRSAPVLDCQAKLGRTTDGPGAFLVNSGNSNAFTGAVGVAAVERIVEAASASLGVSGDRIFTASTGVIGEPLPAERIVAVLDELRDGLGAVGFDAAARAIMTTDTYPKGAGVTADVAGAPVSISGIAKGSGMIAPDMATMLVYIFSDADIDQRYLQDLVVQITDETFNAITVDSDTSTSDSLLIAATGRAGNPRLTGPSSPGAKAFQAALKQVMHDLALQVVRDGEGATKLVQITVSGAQDRRHARTVGMAIANSPLVKTAIAGEDPNWGRIVMAVGKSGVPADRDLLRITFGDVVVAEHGRVAETYREEDGAAHMRRDEIHIGVDLGLGGATGQVWTCDLTHAYIDINADYRS